MSKLKKWPQTIDEHSLTLLLRYVGEFGAIATLISLETGDYPLPRSDIDAVWQLRMHGAVYGLALVYNCEPLDEGEASDNKPVPVFSKDYTNILATDKRTVWACDLNPTTYDTLMWNIGEFGFRALAQCKNRYAIPKFPEYPDHDWALRMSLFNIVRIFETCIQKLYR
jgi:hypothetical protein